MHSSPLIDASVFMGMHAEDEGTRSDETRKLEGSIGKHGADATRTRTSTKTQKDR